MRPAPSDPGPHRSPLRRLGNLLLLLAPPALLGACLAIAGYDGRLPGPAPADDAEPAGLLDGGDPGATEGPGTPLGDGGAADAALGLDNCTALDASCPPAQPHCSIYFDGGAGQHSFACLSASEQDGAPGYEMRCGVAPKECGEGLACGYSWSTGYHCTRVCRNDGECGGRRPFCNHPLTLTAPLGPLSLCETCDPMRTTECTGANQGCLVRGLATDPSCGPLSATAGGLDATCNKAMDCKSGLVCVCMDGQGLGDDCAATAGACRLPCFERGTACPAVGGQPARTCTAAGITGLYAYCKP